MTTPSPAPATDPAAAEQPAADQAVTPDSAQAPLEPGALEDGEEPAVEPDTFFEHPSLIPIEAAARQKLEPWIPKVMHALPWASLALGVGGAVLMDRDPEKGWMAGAAALGGWLLLLGFILLSSLADTALPDGASDADAAKHKSKQRWISIAKFALFMALQNLVQLAIFFSFPLFVRAATFSVLHVGFLAVLGGVAAASLWDPWCEAILQRPVTGALLQAYAAFVGLNVSLQMMGVAPLAAMVGAATAAALGAPLLTWLETRGDPGARRKIALAAAAAALVPALALIPWVRAAVPPAPLALQDVKIGTRIAGKAVADPTEHLARRPAQLVCGSAVWGPRALQGDLVHVWSHDGTEVDRIPLKVRGGRAEGFRTWSKKRNLGATGTGEWTCAVENLAGQVLGTARVRIGG